MNEKYNHVENESGENGKVLDYGFMGLEVNYSVINQEDVRTDSK